MSTSKVTSAEVYYWASREGSSLTAVHSLLEFMGDLAKRHLQAPLLYPGLEKMPGAVTPISDSIPTLVPQFTSSDVPVRVQSLQITSISFSASTTRSGHFNKMVHSLARKSKNGHFYFKRLSRLWNTIPPVDLTSSAEQLDLIRNHFNNNFNPSNPCTFHFLCPYFKCSHTLPPPPTPPFF